MSAQVPTPTPCTLSARARGEGKGQSTHCHLLPPPASLEMKTRVGVSPRDRSTEYFPVGPPGCLQAGTFGSGMLGSDRDTLQWWGVIPHFRSAVQPGNPDSMQGGPSIPMCTARSPDGSNLQCPRTSPLPAAAACPLPRHSLTEASGFTTVLDTLQLNKVLTAA